MFLFASLTLTLSTAASPFVDDRPLPSCSNGKCKNVVYILSDDMRADIGAYGLPVVTPNIDKLSKEALLFEHAFCQFGLCGPSRQSFMTSRRPDTSQVWNFIDTNPLDTQATPGHFRDAGYLSLGLGKTFHKNGGAWNADKYWNTDVQPYYTYQINACPNGGAGGGHCIEEDDKIYDWSLRNKTLEYLRFAGENYKNTSRPFFLMTGFRDPHAPWAAPQRMYDLYDESKIKTAKYDVLGEGIPLIAWSHQLQVKLSNGTEFFYTYNESVPKWVQKDQRHAYYAAVSYVDEHIGDILGLLDEMNLSDETIVVFHADHGYHLGEHGEWEKKSNFDLVVRVPLIIKVPGKTAAAGKKTASYTELVDVFPTLSALAGLPAPSGVDGKDVSALFDNPEQIVKDTAYHQYPACGGGKAAFNATRIACNNTPKNQFVFMGYSLRNADWRYTAWFKWNQTSLTPLWDGDYVEELYTHTGDDSTNMDEWENKNQAADQPEVVKKLHAQLVSFFKSN